MRSTIVRSSVALALLQGVACGGSTPEPAATPTVTTEPATVATVAEPREAVMAAVPEPANVVGLLVWKDPSAMIATTVPGLDKEMVRGLSVGLTRGLFRDTVGDSLPADELAKLVAIDAPVTALVALHPNAKKRDVVAAYSIGLTSIDEAKQLAAPNQLTEISPNVWRIDESRCVLAALPAPIAGRLVCSDSEKGLEALSPYMIRTMPFAPPSDVDLHVEARVAPAEARYGDQVRQLLSGAPIMAQSLFDTSSPQLTRALTEAATGLGDEVGLLIRDVNTLAIDVTAAPSGLTSRGYVTLRSTSSWTAQTLVRPKDHLGAPTEMFWRLPKDSQSAYYGVGDDPSRYTEIRRVLRLLVEGGLAELSVGSEDDRKAIADLMEDPFGPDVLSVSATGGRTLDAKPVDKSDLITSVLSSQMGWTLVGVEGRQSLVAYLRKAVAAYNRPGIQAALKRELLPAIHFVPTLKASAGPAALGAGSLQVELAASIPANKERKTKAQKVTLDLLVMADGPRVWMALGGDKAELVKRLLSVKDGAPSTNTLAKREGLERLRQSKLSGGGFTTLTPMLSGIANSAAGLPPLDGKFGALQQVLQTLPNHGDAPMPVLITATGTEASMSLEIPRSAIDDLGHLLVGGAMVMGL